MRREWQPGDTRMDFNKWRVRRYEVDRPAAVLVVPWQLNNHPTLTRKVRVWGIWPPKWPLAGPPLLIFPVWLQAVNAAWSRAQFASAPAPPSEVTDVQQA